MIESITNMMPRAQHYRLHKLSNTYSEEVYVYILRSMKRRRSRLEQPSAQFSVAYDDFSWHLPLHSPQRGPVRTTTAATAATFIHYCVHFTYTCTTIDPSAVTVEHRRQNVGRILKVRHILRFDHSLIHVLHSWISFAVSVCVHL